MRLLPAYLRAKKNPGGATLQQVLPPELYAHWREAKARYLPNDKSVEKQRPIMAAETLYQAALKQSGLGGKPKVTPVVDAAVKRHKLKTVSTAIQTVSYTHLDVYKRQGLHHRRCAPAPGGRERQAGIRAVLADHQAGAAGAGRSPAIAAALNHVHRL